MARAAIVAEIVRLGGKQLREIARKRKEGRKEGKGNAIRKEARNVAGEKDRFAPRRIKGIGFGAPLNELSILGTLK